MSSDRKWQLWKPRQSNSPSRDTGNQSKTQAQRSGWRWHNFAQLSHLLVGVWAFTGAMTTALNGSLVQTMERQAQTTLFQLRGSVTPPKNIVILAIDENSLEQGKQYSTAPQELAYFEPLQQWPWKRAAYAKVIARLMAAGAKSVAVDVVFDTPSAYGQADDEQLRQVLKQYPGRVTLAALYDEGDPTRSGYSFRLIQPNLFLETNSTSVGSINYPLEPDSRIYRLASEFFKDWAKNNPGLAKTVNEFVATVPSFDEATLKAAGLTYPQPKGNDIFFYGPPGTFEHIPFSEVLIPENWNTYLKKGEYFKDKIVIIGPTATVFQDFHPTPFSESWLHPERMSGVEIHANAIATLLEGRSIAQAIPNAPLRGLLVLVGVAGTGFILSRQKRWPICLGLATGVVIAWGGVSYLLFVYGRLILPTAIPVVAIALCGGTYGTIGAMRELRSKFQLRQTFKRYVSAPIVQQIISEQDDLQDLLQEREQEMLATILDGRYKIVKSLSAGGFGETYIAEDTKRPGNPKCVVKQLSPASDDPKVWNLAKRLFITEAEILERLGRHKQIPQLLAYFAEGDRFFLVEELIIGRPLTHEMPLMVPMAEDRVIGILQELLKLLEFVHSQYVIHRDIKPDNIIRRQSDGKLVLIDFGAVKEIGAHLNDEQDPTQLTVGIGTKGYMPWEQSAGNPRFNSDLYAIGMIAIQSLTLTHPAQLPENKETGDVTWQDKAQVSPELAAILNKMVRCNYRDRYQSATEVLEALKPLIKDRSIDRSTHSVAIEDRHSNSSSLPETEDFTMPWSESGTTPETADSTMPWPERSDSSEIEDATKPWLESDTSSDTQEDTKPWLESDTSSDTQEDTKPWLEVSVPSDIQDSTRS
jgi:CHASE2 domain-containing sensor protein/serine/threonine protein kinase